VISRSCSFACLHIFRRTLVDVLYPYSFMHTTRDTEASPFPFTLYTIHTSSRLRILTDRQMIVRYQDSLTLMVWCGANKKNQMPFHPRTVPNCIASHYDFTAPFNSSHSSLVNPKFKCSSPCVVVIPPKNPARLRFCTVEKAPLQLIANVYRILVASHHQ
jgi:hypothetical protein